MHTRPCAPEERQFLPRQHHPRRWMIIHHSITNNVCTVSRRTDVFDGVGEHSWLTASGSGPIELADAPQTATKAIKMMSLSTSIAEV